MSRRQQETLPNRPRESPNLLDPQVLPKQERLRDVRVDTKTTRFRPQHYPQFPCTINNHQIVTIGELALRMNDLLSIEDDSLLESCAKYELVIGGVTRCLREDYRKSLAELNDAVARERETVATALEQRDRDLQAVKRTVYLTNIITAGTHARLESARRRMVKVIIKNTDDLAAIINLANDAYKDHAATNDRSQRAAAIGIANAVQAILFHYIRNVGYEYARYSAEVSGELDGTNAAAAAAAAAVAGGTATKPAPSKPTLNTISWMKLEEVARGTKRDFTDSSEYTWTRISVQLRYIIVAGQLQKSLVTGDLVALSELGRSATSTGLAIFRITYNTGLYDLLATWKMTQDAAAETGPAAQAPVLEQHSREQAPYDGRTARPGRQDTEPGGFDGRYLPNDNPSLDSRNGGRGRRINVDDNRSAVPDPRPRQERPVSEAPSRIRDGHIDIYGEPIPIRGGGPDNRDRDRGMSSKFERPAAAAVPVIDIPHDDGYDDDVDDPYQEQLRRRQRRKSEGPPPSSSKNDDRKGKAGAVWNPSVDKYGP